MVEHSDVQLVREKKEVPTWMVERCRWLVSTTAVHGIHERIHERGRKSSARMSSNSHRLMKVTDYIWVGGSSDVFLNRINLNKIIKFLPPSFSARFLHGLFTRHIEYKSQYTTSIR